MSRGGGGGQGETKQVGPRGPRVQQQTGMRGGGDAPTPAGGRGVSEEQAQDIVNIIINLPPGGGPYSGKTLESRPRQPSRVDRGRGGI